MKQVIQQPRRKAGQPAREGQKTILLVDDSDVVRGLYADILARSGYHVTQAHDGHEAQRIVEKHGAFDLLITDYQMPGMTGVNLAVWFHERWPRTGVLLVSASPEHLAHASKTVSFVTCLFKTSRPDELLAAAATLVKTGAPPEP